MTDAVGVFVSAFGVAAFAGLASLLRTNKPLTWRLVAAAVMNSGVLGLGISLLWYTNFQDRISFLIGVCVLAGLGGMSSVDFVLAAIRKGGFQVKLGKDGSSEAPGFKLENGDTAGGGDE